MEFVGALPGFEFTDEMRGTGIGPDDRVVQGFSSLGIPNAGRLALVGDADRFNVGKGVAQRSEFFAGLVNACRDGGDELKRVVFVPAAYC